MKLVILLIFSLQKGFAQERYLSDHKKIHFPDTSFLCAICGRSFTSSSLLMRHTIVHTGEKKYSCEVCNRAFSRSDKVCGLHVSFIPLNELVDFRF